DHLYIYNGENVDDNQLLYDLTGNVYPPSESIRTKTGINVMTLRFYSDLTGNDVGYYARYDAIPENVNNDPADTKCPPLKYTDGFGVI
ncbi:hypothetical protein AAVH_39004, partial [Aphelenchoides avenae]